MLVKRVRGKLLDGVSFSAQPIRWTRRWWINLKNRFKTDLESIIHSLMCWKTSRWAKLTSCVEDRRNKKSMVQLFSRGASMVKTGRRKPVGRGKYRASRHKIWIWKTNVDNEPLQVGEGHLPGLLLMKKGLIALVNFDDNLCMFRCLAVDRGANKQ